MNPVARNILAVVIGLVTGSVVNIGLITVGMTVVPLPEGTDVSTMEAVREAMKTFTPMHFLFPWVAHALGTLVGAFIAAKVAASHRMKLAMLIGAFFLLGGIAMVLNCGGPNWFIAADLILAYFPMAWIGGTLAGSRAETAPI